jgi:chlorite dismutase
MSLSLPPIKLDRGLHVMHLFYRVDRVRWAQLSAADSAQVRERLEKLCAAHAAASHPRLATYANVGNKADLGFFLLAAELGQLAQMHCPPFFPISA